MQEQLKLVGNIIEFPKNKEVENKELENKLEVAYSFLKTLAKAGYDFNIVISREASLELFNEKDKEIRDNLVLRTNKDFSLRGKNVSYYTLKGDELD